MRYFCVTSLIVSIYSRFCRKNNGGRERGVASGVDTEPLTSDTAVSEVAPSLATAVQPREKASGQGDNLRRILAIKVPLIVKIAEKRMRIGEILKLSLGSVVQFEKDAYQHVDLMVNNSTIGLGQPVKVGEKFGLKITQIGDISEMIRSLGTGAQPDDSQ
jgi:flagellar motor switch protein FliN